MNAPYMFGTGKGHLSAKVRSIAEALGAKAVNYTDPGCACGHGCRDNCPANRRHWFEVPNRGEPFDGDVRRRVMDAVGPMLSK